MRNPKILIIDDSQFILKLHQAILVDLSYSDVTISDNPKEMVPAVKTGNFDLVLLDLMMPNFSGLDFMKEVSKEIDISNLIVLTSSIIPDEQLMVEINEYGIRLLPKPLFVSELADTLGEMLKKFKEI